MNSGAFARLASVTASTKRGGGIGVDGLETAYAVNLVTLKCLPLDPWRTPMGGSSEIEQGIEGLSFREILHTVVEGGLDIIEGDLLVVGSDEYPIRAVAEWMWPPDGTDCLQLTLEDRK